MQSKFKCSLSTLRSFTNRSRYFETGRNFIPHTRVPPLLIDTRRKISPCRSIERNSLTNMHHIYKVQSLVRTDQDICRMNVKQAAVVPFRLFRRLPERTLAVHYTGNCMPGQILMKDSRPIHPSNRFSFICFINLEEWSSAKTLL